ncbi:glycosyltransferase family 2 protein [Exiguobacterium artemiae]|uniref:glycosyltransferase family 2 protein n=1 Tax=Exiguobacterium artemiae TaxID=340145 RepID=UPI00054FC1BF|nr:glycosyltransferase family 2 protein [Exiguobacterium sibiricum]
MDLSFIIVNYNTAILVEECIDSLLKNKSLKEIEFEIVVVDNGSNDNSVSFLTKKYIKFSNIKVIDSKENNGFGKGNNIGVSNSDGEFICCINSDTISQNTDYLEILSNFKNEKIGILGAKILNKDNSIQSLGFKKPSVKNDFLLSFLFWNFNLIKKIRYHNYTDKGLINVDWVSGCFFLIRKVTFEEVEGFDEKIFMYSEDLDLSVRVGNMGLQNYVLDTTDIYHLHGGSTNNKKPNFQKMLDEKKNYFYVIQKNKLANSLELFLIKIFTKMHVLMLYILKNVVRKIKIEN